MPSSNFSDQIVSLQQEFNNKLPPVDKWNPEFSGDIDIKVDREGRWYHEGDRIERESLVKVFSSVLKKEGEDYFLVTPVEKWRIQVDVAPFFITSMSRNVTDGVSDIAFYTSVGDQFMLGSEHPMWLLQREGSEALPLAMVRQGLEGLISRPVYYELIETAAQEEGDRYYVESQGQRFWLD